MDRYESDEFLSRLYYLVDRNAAIQYAHSTIFENFPLLTHYFPIRAHVEPYGPFVAAHPHFLVITKGDYLEAWILRKLGADGASVRLVQKLHGPGNRPYGIYEIQCRL
jgi:hypothetical protein